MKKFLLGFLVGGVGLYAGVLPKKCMAIAVVDAEITGGPLSNMGGKEGERPDPSHFMQTLGNKVLDITKN
jgi:hypothetical protein